MNNIKNNKVSVFLIIGIIVTLITVFSATYAFFIYRANGSNVSLEAGDISVSFVNGKNYLSAENSYPMSDAMGMISPYYNDFSINAITNNIGIKYEIQIVPNNNNTIDTKYIKVYLTDQKDNRIAGVSYYNNLLDATYNENGKIAYAGYTTNSMSQDFRLRVWIDESYLSNVAQSFGFTIYLYSVNADVILLSEQVIKTLSLTEPDVDGTRYVVSNSNTTATQTENEFEEIKANNLVNKFNSNTNLTTIDTITDVNNYVWYSGKLWRIVSIDKDGNIKLVTQGNISAITWNISATDTAYNTSQIRSWLNNEFASTLVNADKLLISPSWDYTTYSSFPTTKLTATSTITGDKVGLLSIYDFMMTGGTTSSSTTNTFLNNNYYWWTMTPRYNGTKVWNINYDGTAGILEPSSNRGVRPSIVLKSSVSLTGEGDGTKSNPYIINDGYGIGSASSLLSERVSGEYIKFNNTLYRIVKTETINGKKLTKITMADYSINQNSIKVSQKFGTDTSQITFSPTYGIGLYLNDWYNATSYNQTYANVYIDSVYKAMIATNTEDGVIWYTGPTAGTGNDYTLSKTGNTVSATIGLGYYGELFASQYGDGATLSSHFWLISKYSDSQNLFILKYGNGREDAYTNGYAVRPFFYLKSDVKIGDVNNDGHVGTGMPHDPYELVQ